MSEFTSKKVLFGGKRTKKKQKESLIPDNMTGGVFYVRVSTDKQEESGLGLESQKDILKNFAEKNRIYQIGDTFIEIGSGGSSIDKRPVLRKAIELAREYDAYVVVTKLDRLSRRATMISTMLDENVKFVTSEYGFGADTLILRIIAAWGQKERELISERTKNALQQIKKQYEEDYQRQLSEGISTPKKKRLGIPSVAKAPTHISHQRKKEGLQRKRAYYENFILPTKIELEREYPGEKITRTKLANRMKLKGFTTEYGHDFSESVIYHTLKDLKISLKNSHLHHNSRTTTNIDKDETLKEDESTKVDSDKDE